MIRYHLDISVCFLMVIFGRRWHAYALVKSLSCVQLFMTLWTVAHQAPPSMGFSRQECWSGFSHFLLQGIFLTQRLNPGLSHCRQTLYRLSHKGSPVCALCILQIFTCQQKSRILKQPSLCILFSAIPPLILQLPIQGLLLPLLQFLISLGEKRCGSEIFDSTVIQQKTYNRVSQQPLFQ